MRIAPLQILIAAAWLPSVAAQAPPEWSDLSVPAGVDPLRLESRGKLITYRENNTAHVFSAANRGWHAITALPTAPIRLMNDCLLVQDGTTWTAFSAYTSQFSPLPVSLNAQLLNPAVQNNDSILLVLDGSMLHAYSGFVGTWVSRPVTGNTGFAVQRHTALMADGSLVSGMDASTGVWHDMTVTQPPQVLDCDGTAGLAISATEVHGFSSVHRNWRTSPMPVNAALARNDDWALFWNSTQMLGYSGIEGRFVTAPFGASAVPFRSELCAIAHTPVGYVGFSAIRATFSPPLAPTTAAVRIGTATAILVDGLQVTGYSASLGSSTTITLNSAAEAVSSTVATAIDYSTGKPFCYTSLLGTWHAPPLSTQPGMPQLTATSILLQATSGAYAFSSRSGNFVPLSGSGIVLLGNDQSSVGAAWDANSLFAFDTRTDTWRSVSRTWTGPPIVHLWRTSFFAIDGGTAHGFGAQSGTWNSALLPEPYAYGRANSESSRVVTATHILGHSPLPTTLSLAQFPEFRRVQPTGAEAYFSIPLRGGGIAVLAGGLFASSTTPVTGFGDFWLASPLTTILLIAMPGAERATYDLSVPSSPGLVGTQWAFQALCIPALAAPYLGEATGLYLL